MLFLNTRGKGHCQLSCALLISSPANKNQENGRNRLGAYARRWPECCRKVDDDGWGYKTFEIDKGRFCFRLTAPYSEERREAAREVCEGTQCHSELQVKELEARRDFMDTFIDKCFNSLSSNFPEKFFGWLAKINNYR